MDHECVLREVSSRPCSCELLNTTQSLFDRDLLQVLTIIEQSVTHLLSSNRVSLAF